MVSRPEHVHINLSLTLYSVHGLSLLSKSNHLRLIHILSSYVRKGASISISLEMASSARLVLHYLDNGGLGRGEVIR